MISFVRRTFEMKNGEIFWEYYHSEFQIYFRRPLILYFRVFRNFNNIFVNAWVEMKVQSSSGFIWKMPKIPVICESSSREFKEFKGVWIYFYDTWLTFMTRESWNTPAKSNILFQNIKLHYLFYVNSKPSNWIVSGKLFELVINICEWLNVTNNFFVV